MSDRKYQFEEEWDENPPEDFRIEWQVEGRKKLNKVIRSFNEWQMDGFPDSGKQKLLALIEHGIQTFGLTNGGSQWMAALERMKAFVSCE